MADRLEGNDWHDMVVCLDCYALPCGCSRLTRLLERLHRWLGRIVRHRHIRRQEVLQHGR